RGRNQAYGVLDYAKRLAEDIGNGVRDLYGELIHKSAPKPAPTLPPNPVAQASPGKVAAAEVTPVCEKCSWKIMQKLSEHELICANCSHQQYVKGYTPPPVPRVGFKNLPLGIGRYGRFR